MPRSERAKQFAPFDALKGLQQALRMKEYEHDRGQKGDLSEEKILEISKTLSAIKKDDVVQVVYFCDGYEKKLSGKAKVDLLQQQIAFGTQKIDFLDLLEVEIQTKDK